MCGICGWIGNKVEERAIKEMMGALSHRGPDDEGYYKWEVGSGKWEVGLGHRRLSIIDLETGKQPIHNEDKTIWIVFNGEIYNYLELRDELERKRHRFYTNSDTEVIVHLYEEFGQDCVRKLNGMFAFVLWDQTKERLLLVRDRLGIKPLHYAEVDGGLVFASEIKALLKHPAIKREIDLLSLSKYLTFEYVPAPNTIFKGIRKLLPGHLLIWEKGRIATKQYWKLSFSTEHGARSTEQIIERLLELLKASVKRQLISDVPLGAFLSGGIDSSSIAAFMSELVPGQVKTFSIGFEDSSFDESVYAAKVARHLGCDHHQEILSPKKALDLVPKIADILDEPFGDASIIPTYLLSEFTRKHVKVSLSGDGGDELFAGYPTYQAHRIAELYLRLPQFIQRGVAGLAKRLPVSTANISLDFKAKRFISGIGFEPAIRNYIWLGSFAPEEKENLFLSEVNEKLNQEDPFQEVREQLKGCDATNLLEKMLCLDMRFYLADNMLVKIDRASMANSLEGRVPFLDHTLVEFVTSLPANLKLRGLTTKYILKKAMKKRLPKGIANRPKKGFGIPVARWIKGELKELVLDMVNPTKIKREGFFCPQYIDRLLADHFKGRKDNRKLIWTLLVFELWHQKYM
ncbi:asparagine synthase (glutamine-hydrolyzing) [bacterium]|nr:asparagine synthase (glutamine-hydrolyzing) [bacterium]